MSAPSPGREAGSCGRKRKRIPFWRNFLAFQWRQGALYILLTLPPNHLPPLFTWTHSSNGLEMSTGSQIQSFQTAARASPAQQWSSALTIVGVKTKTWNSTQHKGYGIEEPDSENFIKRKLPRSPWRPQEETTTPELVPGIPPEAGHCHTSTFGKYESLVNHIQTEIIAINNIKSRSGWKTLG